MIWAQCNPPPFNSWPKDPMPQTIALQAKCRRHEGLITMSRQARLLRSGTSWSQSPLTTLTAQTLLPWLDSFFFALCSLSVNTPITWPTYSNKKSRSFPRFLANSLYSKLSLIATNFTFHLSPLLSIHMASHLNLCYSLLFSVLLNYRHTDSSENLDLHCPIEI